MRNLKKVLALVLAMVMALSLMSVASAKTEFEDIKEVDSKYSEAVQVLGGLGVFKGRSATESDFDPKASITRAEVAAIIYRIDSLDVDDKKDDSYANSSFKDVPNTHWAAGYIGYCANGQLVKGYGDTFGPSDSVTGYQVLAMILRTVGYEGFEGPDWQIKTATRATQLGLTSNVTNSQILTQPATRELVADLLFQTLVKAEVVYKNSLWEFRTTNNFQPNTKGNNGKDDITLGEKQFGLARNSKAGNDSWGRPVGVEWTKDGDWETNTSVCKVTDDVVATLSPTPDMTYTKAVTECDLAEDIDLKKTETYTMYVNGKVNAVDYDVQPTDLVQKIGGTGTLVEVYKADKTIVVINTFLAKVVKVDEVEYDAAGANVGHVKVPARLTLLVYTSPKTNSLDQSQVPDSDQLVTDNGFVGTYAYQTSNSNYTYSVGDMLLINTYTVNGRLKNGTVVVGATGDDEIAGDYTYTGKVIRNAASTDSKPKGIVPLNQTTNGDGTFTTEGLASAEDNRKFIKNEINGSAFKFDKLDIKGTPTVVSGSQNFIWANEAKHTVNDKNYDDAEWLRLDQAGDQTTVHNWYLDQYGYIIGIADPTGNISYGVISKIQWINPQLETGYALAEFKLMDGTTVQKKVSHLNLWDSHASSDEDDGTAKDASVKLWYTKGDNIVDFNNAVYEDAKVATTLQENSEEWVGKDLFAISENKDGSVKLEHVNYVDETADPIHQAAEIVDAEILTDKGMIAGTAGGDGNVNTIYVNESTIFMTSKYVVTTGVANIAKYSGTAAKYVDYVDVDSDGVADYVYIIGKSDVSSGSNLVYLTSDSVKVVLKGDGGVDHYEVQGYVDGVFKTDIKVATGDDVNDADNAVIDKLVPLYRTQTDRKVYSKIGTLFGVDMNDGKIVSVIDLSTTTHADGSANVLDENGSVFNKSSIYDEDDRVVFFDGYRDSEGDGSKYVGHDLYKNGNFLYSSDSGTKVAYNVTGITPIGDGWRTDLGQKDVYLIYNKDTYVVKAAYIDDPCERITSGSVPSDGPAKFSSVKMDDNGTITVTMTGIPVEDTKFTVDIEKWTNGGWLAYDSIKLTVTGSENGGTEKYADTTLVDPGSYRVTCNGKSDVGVVPTT